MISRKTFNGSEEYTVDSYKALIDLCGKLREKDDKPYTIYIKGTKKEVGNYVFPYSCFHIVAVDIELDTVLYAKMKDREGKELTTWKTAALKVTGSHNLFENLHIANIAYQPEVKGQEVALGVYGDDNIFVNCHLSSTQDTLFAGPLPDDLSTRYIDFLPQDERYFEGMATDYFFHCTIEGSVDFIFGAGRAVFDQCDLVTVKDSRNESYVAAPSHSLKDDFGYLFYQCHFIKGEGVNPHTIFLARPWRDYGKAVFAKCRYDDHISPLGFHDWSDVNRIRTARFEEYPLKDGRVSWTKNKKDSTLPERYSKAVEELREHLK